MSRIFDNDALNYLNAQFASPVEAPITMFAWVKPVDMDTSREGILGLSKDPAETNHAFEIRTGNVVDEFEAYVDNASGSNNYGIQGTVDQWFMGRSDDDC